MTPDDFLSRLSAGLDRDDQLARAAAEADDEGPSWRVRKVRDNGMYVWGAHQAIPPNGKGERLGLVDDAQTHHIEAHDPARALRELPLKRLILDEHTPLTTKDYESPGPAVEIVVCACCSFLPSPQTDAYPQYVTWPCDYIHALASIYADPAETGGES